MKLSIIALDKAVYKDGLSYSDLTLDTVPQNIRALQWDTDAGHIEYNDGTQNEEITSLPDWTTGALDEWQHAYDVAHEPTPPDTFEEEIVAVHAQFPAMNDDAIAQLLANKYQNLVITKTVRAADATVIGISVEATAGYDNNTGAVGLLSLRTCTNDAIALGVPMLSILLPREGTITKDQFADFLLSISPYNKIIYSDKANYVYQDWNIPFAKNRKRTIINTERAERVNAGITWNNYNWNTDDVSRSNLVNALAVVNAGGQLPADFVWRTSDNQNVPMDAVGLKALNEAVAAQTNAFYQQSWNRKAALDALPADCTYAEIDAI